MALQPTAEQQAILDAAATGEHLKIEALAGTGKTTTLEMIARSMPHKRFLYIAYNKSIATEAEQRFPSNVECRTAHSLAYRAVGLKYKARLNAKRPTLRDTARALGLSGGVSIRESVISEPALARHIMDTVTRLCRTTDTEVGKHHVPLINGLDPLDKHGNPTRGKGHDDLVDLVLPAAQKAWIDIQNPRGVLRFSHDHYLKIWADSKPHLDYDVVLLDEAQDADPLIARVVDLQRHHAQVILVGDSNQAIYEWRGAVNAIANFSGQRLVLTESWRFGPAVAEQGNHFLAQLGTDLRVVGNGGPSEVRDLTDPDAILCRTNAGAISALLEQLAVGRKAHLIGGSSDIEGFCRAAADLKQGKDTIYPDLAAFRSWGEVQDYVRDDPNGADLAVLVRLVDNYGAYTILDALRECVSEERADVVISTAHKSKGREWARVRISSDFEIKSKDKNNPPPPPSPEYLRLAYVAVTRARVVLDPGPLASGGAALAAA